MPTTARPTSRWRIDVVAHTVYPQRYGGVVSLENELSPQQLYVFYGHPFQVAHDGDGVGSGQSKQSSSPGTTHLSQDFK